MTTKHTERTIQAILMFWLMNEKQHLFAIPNPTMFFNWEADLVSATAAGLTHEFEIKTTLADFRRDAQKVHKHSQLADCNLDPRLYKQRPCYFWYATPFEIVLDELLDHAGWVTISETSRHSVTRYEVTTRRTAPRLAGRRMDDKSILQLGRLASYRLAKLYRRVYDPHYADLQVYQSDRYSRLSEDHHAALRRIAHLEAELQQAGKT